MKEIVVISGKGGTGKTSVTAALAMIAGRSAVIADCDVDAADMHLLLDPEIYRKHDFFSGELASIDTDKCNGCGICADICRFGAIAQNNGTYKVIPIDCEGCGYCARVCPEEAITNQSLHAGNWFVSFIKNGSVMAHARLGTGADNSGKLVAKVKNEAETIARENGNEFILVDGPPGIGCPVISSLSGADLVVLVTEPTISAFHDLKRIYQLVKGFGISSSCIINKADLNRDITLQIGNFLKKNKIAKLAEIPYSKEFTSAMLDGETIVEYNTTEFKELIHNIWLQIEKMTIEKMIV